MRYNAGEIRCKDKQNIDGVRSAAVQDRPMNSYVLAIY
jgi:hypothetical protein